MRGDTHFTETYLTESVTWYNKMASVCRTRGRRSVSFFAALNICLCRVDAKETHDRQWPFLRSREQSWLAELRQILPQYHISLAIQHGNSLTNKS